MSTFLDSATYSLIFPRRQKAILDIEEEKLVSDSERQQLGWIFFPYLNGLAKNYLFFDKTKINPICVQNNDNHR